MIAIEQSLGLWIPQVTGRYINEDWNPQNEGFGAQCWDVAANWSRHLGLPVISTGGEGRWPGWAGNMVDAFPQSAAISAAYELVDPDQPGLPGDIPVWGDGYYYYPKTHVAVLVRDLSGQLLCISQNSSASREDNPYPQWTTGPTILQHLPRRGLIGFIRPRTGGVAAQGTITTTTSQEGFLMALNDEQQDILYNAVLNLQGFLWKGGPSVKGEEGAAESIFGRVIGVREDTQDIRLALTSALPALLNKKDGTVNIPELAKALAGQLAEADVHALAAQLQITVKGN